MRPHLSHILFLLLLGIAALYPTSSAQFLLELTRAFSDHFGWAVMLICSLFVIASGYFMLSRYGQIRLGKDDSRAEFSYASWIAMLFAAGMGTGLVFYGAAEPLLHTLSPPPGTPVDANFAQTARTAMAVTYFHWGIHAWAIYAIAGLAIAYFTFRCDRPMLPSAPCIATTNGAAARSGASIINSLAILAIIFGLVASISQGVLLVSEGLARQTGLTDAPSVRVFVVLLLAVCYMLSALTGIKRGIKWLSNANMIIAIALMGFVLFSGPSVHMLNVWVSGIGDYLAVLPSLSFDSRPYAADQSWLSTWSVNYFLWWVAWAPFVGVFIARISRGRTVREFLLGVIIVPTIASTLWFAVFGGTGLHLLEQQPELFTQSSDHIYGIIFTVLAQLPMAEITLWLTLALVFVFLITSADSGMYILGMFSQHGALHPSLSHKLFWGIMIAAITAIAVGTGGDTAFFRAVAASGSIPYIVIMVVQLLFLLRHMQRNHPQKTR